MTDKTNERSRTGRDVANKRSWLEKENHSLIAGIDLTISFCLF